MIELYPCFSHLASFNNIFIISDPHFSDPNMPFIRKNYIGDEEQVKRINSKVGKKDVLIILGDIGNIEYVKQLRGYKILIMGNHDKGASNYKKGTINICPSCGSLNLTQDGVDRRSHCYTCADCHGRFDLNYSKKISNNLFDEVYTGIITLNDKIVLSHEPINIPFMFNIHGHDHSNKESTNDGLHFNACAEHIDYTPVSLLDIVKSGKLKKVQSIHRLTIDKATEHKNNLK